jgi:hypothetical protein
MRRLAVLLGIVLIAFASSAVAVSATGTTTLTGTSEWPGQFTDPVTVTVVHGTFAGSLGKGTYEGPLTGGATYSCDFVSGCQPVTGTITFSGNRGSFTGVVQPGSFVGLEDFHPRIQSRTFSLTLLVTDGTRGYAHADGSLLTLSYHSERRVNLTEDFQIVVTITDSGVLTGTLH